MRTTYFNSLLLPVAILLRVLDRLNTKTTESSLDLWVPPEPLNWLLERPLALEAALIGRGGRIPAGLSLLRCLPLEPRARARLAARLRARRRPTPARAHAERPRAVGEEREDRDDDRRQRLAEQLVQARLVHEHVQQAQVEAQAARPARRPSARASARRRRAPGRSSGGSAESR